MSLGGREALSLRSRWNDRAEPVREQLGEKHPDGSSFSPQVPSTRPWSKSISKETKSWRVKPSPRLTTPPIMEVFRARTGHRRLGWERIYTSPSLLAGVPQASWGQGHSSDSPPFEKPGPYPISLTQVSLKSQAKPDPWAEPAGATMPGPQASWCPRSTARMAGASRGSFLI